MNRLFLALLMFALLVPLGHTLKEGGDSEAALERKLASISGVAGTNCGLIKLMPDPTLAWACAKAHEASKKPFWLALQMRSTDSEIWQAIAQNNDGNRYVIFYTSNNFGQPEFLPHFDVHECFKPFSFNPTGFFLFECGEISRD